MKGNDTLFTQLEFIEKHFQQKWPDFEIDLGNIQTHVTSSYSLRDSSLVNQVIDITFGDFGISLYEERKEIRLLIGCRPIYAIKQDEIGDLSFNHISIEFNLNKIISFLYEGIISGKIK